MTKNECNPTINQTNQILQILGVLTNMTIKFKVLTNIVQCKEICRYNKIEILYLLKSNSNNKM